MRHLEIEVTNAAELLATEAYGAGALLRWESSAAEAGAYVEGGTLALVSGTTLYDVWDAAGIETTWYRTRISDAAGTTFSAYSDPRSPVTSLVSIAEVRALVESAPQRRRPPGRHRPRGGLARGSGRGAHRRADRDLPPGLGDAPLYLRRRADVGRRHRRRRCRVAARLTCGSSRPPALVRRSHRRLDRARSRSRTRPTDDGRGQARRDRARPRHRRRDGPRRRVDRRLRLHPRRERRARRACRPRPEHPPAPAGLLDAPAVRDGAGMSFDGLLIHTLAVERATSGALGAIWPAVPHLRHPRDVPRAARAEVRPRGGGALRGRRRRLRSHPPHPAA